ncbi:SUMF1/EgtB/PvdO family nonheme iron enzyme [Azospirillum sp.]|uniref:SUMF1/EgtB/PvdO family nonheme iron enzyme n=1 Tax=Azospirillum sp. TaxID=34012 RepID=UPI003D723DDE
MIGRCGRCLLVLAVLLVAAGGALAAGGKGAPSTGPEKRIALVIGVSKYQSAPELVNPRNDAQSIGEALRKLDFTVEEAYDLDARGFATTLRQFGIRASQADVAVLYYAGHGIQVSGVNYLLPSDAQLERERDLVYEAIPLNLPLGELGQARKLGILILDACRNNPFVDRLTRTGTTRIQAQPGFGRVDDTPSDTLVAMATRADQLAEDGTGDHSPYTAALLKHLQTPGLELSLFFRNVRDTVKEATDGRQDPFIYGSLGATPFYFNPRPPNRPPVIGELKPLTVLDKAPAEPLRIGRPTDPDDDQLFARVTGLPKGGTVGIGERSVLIGDYLTVDQLAATSFKPDASFRGEAGSFEFTVMDGHGANVRGALPITIKPSNQPPALVAERTLKAVPNPMRIEAPVDPDGDPLTITVTAVPERGKVKNGAAAVKVGDKLSIEALTGLVFDPERAPPGPAGTFGYTADDGKGGTATAKVVVEVVEPGTVPVAEMEETVWKRIQSSTEHADYDSFLRLFGKSGYAALARQQLEKLGPRKQQSETAPAPKAPEMAQRPDTAVSGSSGAPEPPREPARTEVAALGVPKLDPMEPGRYTVASDAVLRATPSNGAARVGRAGRGSAVQVQGRVPGGAWVHVTLEDGTQGFVAASLLKHEPPPPPKAAAVAPPPTPTPEPQQVAAAAPPPPGNTPNGTARTHGPGNSFFDCPGCPVMVRVPAGSFMMGSDKGDSSERPVHRVTIAKPFALGAYEVTVGEWRACVQGGGCPDMPRMTNATENTPVYNVHWDDAQAYVKWLSQKTGQRYRLPSEAEWEYAARAGTTGPFWWSGEPATYASCQNCGGTYEHLTPANVGSFKPNPFGLHDMNGGVAEWVADCWNKDYAGAPSDGSPWLQGSCRKRVLRGGAWRNSLAEITDTARNFYDVDVRYINNGFRVARDLN